MQRLTPRSAGLYLILALVLTACFQPVGAALEPTSTGNPPLPIATGPGFFAPTTDAELTATAVFFLPTISVTPSPTVGVTPLVFPTPITPSPTVAFDPIVPTNTAVPPTIDFGATNNAAIEAANAATGTAIALFNSALQATNQALDAQGTQNAIAGANNATSTALSSTAIALQETLSAQQTQAAASPTPTITPTFTETPTLIPPTETPTEEPPTPTSLGPTATPTLFLPTLDPELVLGITEVAAQASPIFPTQDLQATLNAQATQIIAIVTATAAANATATSQALGTPLFPQPGQETPGGEQPTPITTLFPVFTVGPGTPTFPPGTPGTPGSGASGPITGDCRYTVVDGDRLLRIALRFNQNTRTLARVNGIVNPDLIRPGQRLLIPNCGLQPPSATPGQPQPPAVDPSGPTWTPGPNVTVIVVTATPVAGRVYVVQEGDTLFKIASRFGVRVTAIAQANGIENINLIYIGQRLIIP